MGNIQDYIEKIALAKKQFEVACNRYVQSKEHQQLIDSFRKLGAFKATSSTSQ